MGIGRAAANIKKYTKYLIEKNSGSWQFWQKFGKPNILYMCVIFACKICVLLWPT